MPAPGIHIKSPGKTSALRNKSAAAPILVSAAGLLIVFAIAYFLRKGVLHEFQVSKFREINFTFTMQLYALPVSFAGLLFVFLFDRAAYHKFLRLRLTDPKDSDSNWSLLGPVLAALLTLGTILMMSPEVISGHGKIGPLFWKLLPLVMLFAATNAWTEEILSRFVLAAGLSGRLKPEVICLVSGALFGLAHLFGTPSGLFGVIVTGILGWTLAKSVTATRSMGWAFLIHFLLDTVIFGAGAMVLAGSV